MRKAFEDVLSKDPYDELTHKAFADWLLEQGLDSEAEYHLLWTKEWQESKDYLENYAEDCGYHYTEYPDDEPCIKITLEMVVEGTENFLNTWNTDWGYPEGENWVQLGSEAARDNFNKEEFWKHYQIYMRKEIDKEKHKNPFSCSC